MANATVTLAALMNNLTFQTIYSRLKNLALNVFKWEGLPEGLKQEYIEMALYTHGQALFFKDVMLGFMCLQCLPDGQVNVYGEPVNYRAIGFNYTEPYNIDNSVRMKNNLALISTHDYIMIFANKLYEIERTLDVNIKAQKTPYIIRCSDKNLLTFKNIFAQVDGNVPAIYVDKMLNIDDIGVIETQAPYIADKVSTYKHEVMDDINTFLGINNSNTQKKERLITDEVNSNNEMISMSVDYLLEERKKACEAINKMFGLSVSVDLKNKPEPVEEQQPDDPDSKPDDDNVEGV